MIRPATASDTASVVEVWRAAGLRFYQATAERELTTAISQQLVLIDEQPDGEVAGTVFGGCPQVNSPAASSAAAERSPAADDWSDIQPDRPVQRDPGRRR
jgi:hypothetical protein